MHLTQIWLFSGRPGVCARQSNGSQLCLKAYGAEHVMLNRKVTVTPVRIPMRADLPIRFANTFFASIIPASCLEVMTASTSIPPIFP